MSIVQEILYIISNHPGGYRMIYDMLYDSESPEETRDRKICEHTVRNTLSRLKKKGLIENKNQQWRISVEGKEFLEGQKGKIKNFLPKPIRSKRAKQKKELIIIFDIPEKERRYRDWLRIELIGFGFDQVQKSVWFGPALPQNFLKYLAEIDVMKYTRFFKASEKDLI